MLNMFFAFYVIAIMVITMIIYIPLIIQKKVSLKDFIIKYIKINITNICIYFFVYYVQIRFFKVPINQVGLLDIIIPTFCIFVLILFLRILFKTTKKQKIKILKILLVIIFYWSIMFSFDYYSVSHNKYPIFCTNFNNMFEYQDGGTVIYFGVGYKVFVFCTPKLKGGYICPIFTDYNTAYIRLYEKQNK